MIYLDHHATTPCDPAVLEAMWPWFSERFGNAASRSHALGHTARAAVEDGRAAIAAWIGCSPKEVVFTSGATESNNLAILGTLRAQGRGHAITVATEHSAVLDPFEALRSAGLQTTVLPVDGAGLVSPQAVIDALQPETALVSVMLVNNEIGVLQPVAQIAAACRERGVPVHCDAAQASAVAVDVDALGVDLLSLSAHKVYGPKGVGALYVRRRRPRQDLTPLQYGGGHERGLRSGTLPVPLVVGFGEAARRVVAGHEDGEPVRISALRDRLLAGLSDRVAGVALNGPAVHRAPNNLNVSIAGVEAQALLMAVRDEVALSSGSACASETLKRSHVLKALGLSGARAQSSVRFGLGRTTTEAQIDRVIEVVSGAAEQLRMLGVE